MNKIVNESKKINTETNVVNKIKKPKKKLVKFNKIPKVVKSLSFMLVVIIIGLIILFSFGVAKENIFIMWFSFGLNTIFSYSILILYFTNTNIFSIKYNINYLNTDISLSRKSILPVIMILSSVLSIQIFNFYLFPNLTTHYLNNGKDQIYIDAYNFITSIFFTTIYVGIFANMLAGTTKYFSKNEKIKFCIDNKLNIFEIFELSDMVTMSLKKNKSSETTESKFKEEMNSWLQNEVNNSDNKKNKKIIKFIHTLIE